jgi:hypothetical protein
MPNRPKSALGITIGNIAQASGCNVEILEVLPEGSAAVAGIMKGDCVLAFAGKTVNNRDQLNRLIEGSEVGAVTTIKILRGGALMDVLVTPGAASNSRCAAPASWDEQVRGWAKLGSPQCRGAKVGYYLRFVTNANRAVGTEGIKSAWKQYSDTYPGPGQAGCPEAEEMVFFDRSGNSGAGILFSQKPPRWDDVCADQAGWLLRDASNQIVVDAVCFFAASDGRPTPGW